jgi:hypothetical protein
VQIVQIRLIKLFLIQKLIVIKERIHFAHRGFPLSRRAVATTASIRYRLMAAVSLLLVWHVFGDLVR